MNITLVRGLALEPLPANPFPAFPRGFHRRSKRRLSARRVYPPAARASLSRSCHLKRHPPRQPASCLLHPDRHDGRDIPDCGPLRFPPVAETTGRGRFPGERAAGTMQRDRERKAGLLAQR